MTDRTFVRFTEENEWEGETWNFWLQVEGNELELAKLAALVRTPTTSYELDLTAVAESDVDVLVRHASVGYTLSDTKIVGRFTCPPDPSDLYKGGIVDRFVKEDE